MSSHLKQNTMSRSACAERLRAVQLAFANPVQFAVGDLIVLNPLMIPAGHTNKAMARGIYMPMVVLEVVANQSELHESECGALWPGQWFRSAEVSTEDTIAMQWCPSWMYVLAPPDMLADVASTANH